MYGFTTSSAVGVLHLELDGDTTEIQLNDNSTSPTKVTPMYRAENMSDGDHQLAGNVYQLATGMFSLLLFQ